MNELQWKLVLEAEDNCIRCMAHQPELSYDILPFTDSLVNMQAEWIMREKYYD